MPIIKHQACSGYERSCSLLLVSGYGAHADDYPGAYLTVAAAMGMTRSDVDLLCERLDTTIAQYKEKLRKGHKADKILV